MTHGKNEEIVRGQALLHNKPLPKWLLDKPEIDLGNELYYHAYMDLSSCRGGMGDGPISFVAVMQYCDAMQMDREQKDDLLFLIPRIDRIYLDWREEKRKQEK